MANTPPKKKMKKEVIGDTSSAKKKWYNQHFRAAWLEEADFRDWLRQVEDGCYCTICKAPLKNANKSMLKSHKNSAKHKKNADTSMLVANNSADSFHFAPVRSVAVPVQSDRKVRPKAFRSPTKPMNTKVAKAELLLTAFFAQHNIPFLHLNHFYEVCKKAFPDSDIAQNLNVVRNELSKRDGIANHERNDLAEILKTQKFSILMDESTDSGSLGKQILPIVIHFFDTQSLQVNDTLLDAVVVRSGSSQDLYEAVTSTLAKDNIPLSNIIGFASDTCSTMMGENSLFQEFLKVDVQDVFIMGCICHSFSLCSSMALKVLPSFLEPFLKDLMSYFSQSSNIQNDFKRIQSVGTKEKKKSNLSQPRWLFREKVVKAILEQWDALLQYFQSRSRVHEEDIAKGICETMINNDTKPMLLFLEYILTKVNALTEEFQSEHFRLHLLYAKVSFEYQSILSCFIKDDVLFSSKLSDIDPGNRANYKDMKDVYLGGRTMSYLKQNPIDCDTNKFKTDCIHFLIELCYQMKRRFPLDESSVFALLKILDPKVAQDANQSPESIIPLAVNFPSLAPENTLNELDDEWRAFRHYKGVSPLAKSIPEFWYSLQNIKDMLGHSKFGWLSQFMTNLTVLPHSSACVARIFSQINCSKIKSTKRLKTEILVEVEAEEETDTEQPDTSNGASCNSLVPHPEFRNDTVACACDQSSAAQEGTEIMTINDDDEITYTIGHQTYSVL